MLPDRMTFDPRIEGSDIRVWACLAFIARMPSRETTTATDQDLAEKLGVSPQTIRRSLLRLEQAGYIKRERAEHGHGRIITLIAEGDGTPIPGFGLRVATG